MTAEDRLTKLEEAMLVQAELVTRLERRVEGWMQNTQDWMQNTQGWMQNTQDWMQNIQDWVNRTQEWIVESEKRLEQGEDHMAQLEAISTAVLERMDRFIQGREGNGQK